jgi:glutaredoxin 3
MRRVLVRSMNMRTEPPMGRPNRRVAALPGHLASARSMSHTLGRSRVRPFASPGAEGRARPWPSGTSLAKGGGHRRLLRHRQAGTPEEIRQPSGDRAVPTGRRWACSRWGSEFLPAVLGALVLLTACRESSPTSPDEIPLPRVRDEAELLFTFFDTTAQMRTVDRASRVPSPARPAVMVTSIQGRRPAGDQIFVTDLTKKDGDGSYRVWIEERGTWLDRVMPRASVARLSPKRTRGRAGPARGRRTGARRSRQRTTPSAPNQARTNQASAQPGAAEPKAQQQPKVVMFSTSWCPSCRSARQFLSQSQVPYVELDVEKNKAAAQQMVAIQQQRGMRVGSVPLIVVGNQVFQGFSRMQLAAAISQLSTATPPS